MKHVDVLIIGAGPSGLAAAVALRKAGIKEIMVVEREAVAGGVPRHCQHIGFGIKDMRRILTGPDYARRYVQQAEAIGVEIVTNTMVTGWSGEKSVQVTSPDGIEEIVADAIVLATGCRERPRAGRLIPGSRPEGIFTTGALQQWIYLHQHPIGKRAVVVGAEHVSFSALMSLKHAGVDVIAMITDQPHHQSFFMYKLITATRWRIPLMTNAYVSEIRGKARLESIEVTDANSKRHDIICDTLVFTGDWIPDYELAQCRALTLAENSRSPQIDSQLRTSSPGIFAVGNLIHAVETADIAALSGRYVANPVLNYLQTGQWRNTTAIPILTSHDIDWVSPQIIDAEIRTIPNQHLSLRVKKPFYNASISVLQGDNRLFKQRYRRLMPNLPIHLPVKFLSQLRSTEALRLVID